MEPSSIGLNVSADGRHTAEWIAAAGAGAVRIVLTEEHDLRPRLREYRDAGFFVLAVLARESFDGFASWREAVDFYERRYVRKGLIDAVQVGNESDLASLSSWTMDPDELSRLGWTVRDVLPNMVLVCAGMASGQPTYLDAVDLRWANVIAVHPYAKDGPNPDDVEDLPDADELIRAYQRFGLAIWISEWGWWGDEERGYEETRDMVRWALTSGEVERYFHFAADDEMVVPFGLYREDGTPKPAAIGFLEAVGSSPAPQVETRAKAGPGLMDMMTRDRTAPIEDSWWHVNDIDEGCYATNGDTYIWIASAGRGFRVPGRAA